ncbi:MAG: hypothetical protein AB7U82_35620 [Blastocatellales bacterium]
MKVVASILILLSLQLAAKAQTSFRDDPTTVNESGYFVANSTRGYKVIVALIVSNPYENRFASRPSAQVTLRGADGSVLTSRELNGAGIPPKGVITICETITADEKPTRVDVRPLSASYEATDFKSSEFRPFTLDNVRAKPNDYGYMKVTGEIRNPFPKQTGVWVCFLFRDKQNKLIGGHKLWKSEVPTGDPIAFEMSIPIDELPENLGSIEKFVFSHNNYQSSWREILRQ